MEVETAVPAGIEFEDDVQLGPSEQMVCPEDEEMLPRVTLMGHDREKKKRSKDVNVEGTDENVDFSDMQLSDDILKGLKHCRYDKPTPIQLRAIPLGKLNYDLLLQAKSGTGKTCVFTVCILQEVVVSDKYIQAIVVTPSREIAVQISNVMKSIGSFKDGLKVKEFIGGTSVAQTIRRISKCHVAVGTPGRIAHMIKDYNMDLSRVKVAALDEADKLMESSFFDDLKVIFNALPENKQMIATSATYSEIVVNFLETFMQAAYRIQLDLSNPALCAVDQYMLDVKKMSVKKSVSGHNQNQSGGGESEETISYKFNCLKDILKRVSYTQTIVFSNWQLRAERLYDELKELDFDVELLSAARSQEDRLLAFNSLQQGKCKILVATDVASRGIDVEGVDLVINFDIPKDSDTYIHRVGRTGRFGASGKALSLCYFENERKLMSEFQLEIHFTMWVIESLQELSGINDHSSKVQTFRQLRGVKDPITLQDPENKNWKETFIALGKLKLEEFNIKHKTLCGFNELDDIDPEGIEYAIKNGNQLLENALDLQRMRKLQKKQQEAKEEEKKENSVGKTIDTTDIYSDSEGEYSSEIESDDEESEGQI